MRKTAPKTERSRAPARPLPVEKELSITLGQATGVYLLLAVVFFLPAFLPGQQIYGTDYIGGGFFFYDFISERLGAGALPKWVPYVFGGMPLFANPGSTFQPAHFFGDLFLSTSRVLAFVFLVHFWVAGVGMYLFAKELGCRSWVAFVAGLAFQFTGIITSWVYAGHDGRIIVATLAPLFFHFLHQGVRTARVAPFAGAAATLGAALLSFQIQNSYYMLLGAAIWGVFCLVHLRHGRSAAVLARVAALGLAAVAFGFLLAAVNFLPFLGYVPESPRGMEGGRGFEYSITFSMPTAEILSLAVPEHHGVSVRNPTTGEPLFPSYVGENPFKLHTEYVGLFVIILVALGAVYSRRDPRWLFFAGLALFMMTIALGGNTPLYRLYFELLPGTQRFRAPSLSFFVVAMSLICMAAITLERIAAIRADAAARRAARTDPEAEFSRLPWIVGGVVALGVLGFLATAGEPAAARGGVAVSLGWARFVLFAALVGGALWLWVRHRVATTAFALALAAITVADLWVIGRRFMHTVDPPEAIFAADDVIRFLQAQPEPARIWTFPFPEHYRGAGTYGGNFPMHFGIEQVGGEHPNMLQRWVEYVGAGTQTYIDWHNLITGAEVVSTAEGGQAIAFQARPGFLEAANVRYLVSMAPLAHPSLREVHRGSALVYEHVGAMPRAYLVGQVRPVPAGQTALAAMLAEPWDPREVAFVSAESRVQLTGGAVGGSTRILLHEPDRVVVHASADRPALLVLADNYYDGWRATVNGQPAEVVLANHTFRGVAVPQGDSTIEFEFRPASLYTGLYITVGGFLLLIGFGVFELVRSRRRRSPTAEAM
jgi:hypothetical protein